MTSLRASSSEGISLPLLFAAAVALYSVCLITVAEARNLGSCNNEVLPCGPAAFTFYLHNTVYNPAVDNQDNFNSIYGLPPNISFPNPYTFGVMNTFEDPITSGPSNTSAPLGKAQGFYLLNSFNEYTLFHVFTANITEGDYKGTISIFGQVREVDPVRYLTVIGGTGAFLGARGLATNRLIDIDHVPPAKWTMSFELDLYY
ncbi:hypothetical protein KP509_1Z091100 [Ceratopteris richardii]|nr:hypothetical protein KP509_1Z283200 [Ceratopteris richardii]KAH6557825.1 hypothetical protein KP509_1Z090700 [Ceratopteris richardii]KAH6557827.1 hypothetical protein KP509_1Z090900 [Ceratopteris richardii]KAH6557829.1 hypothetical protein KP509_1Z091100 [Ceratopteris richardii]